MLKNNLTIGYVLQKVTNPTIEMNSGVLTKETD